MNIFDLVRSGLFVLAHWLGGSLGASIVAASVALRVAMLPLTIPATRRALVRERRLRALAPAVAQLRQRWAKQPDRLLRETQALYRAHGVSPLDARSLLDGALQIPPGALLYGAIARLGKEVGGFLWVPSLIAPDRALAALAAVLTAGGAWIATRSPEAAGVARVLPLVMSGIIGYVVLSHLSAGVALYSMASSAITSVERAVVRRSLERTPA